MTLHQTIEIAKKFLLGIGAGVGTLIVIFLLFQFGVIIKNMLFPKQTQPPTNFYGKLPPLQFPQNVTDIQLNFELNTITGTLPEFPDRLALFPLEKPQPNFLNLTKAKEKAGQMGFLTNEGTLVPEKRLDASTYEWVDTGNPSRKLTMNIINFDFSLESNFASASAGNVHNEKDALNKAKVFLDAISLTPRDLDVEKTNNPPTNILHTTKPQLFSIENGTIVPTTLLTNTQVIRVDLYQKDVAYDLNTGIPEITGGIKKLALALPILYPRPPYSTMNFWIASNGFDTQVVAADFLHRTIIIDKDVEATYPIKTAQEAFDELLNDKGYIAAYHGTETTINITNVYLGYYLGQTPQEYIMPIIVFAGDNGFLGYVSAVKNEWISLGL